MNQNPFEDPSRYRKDHRGAFIPIAQIREIDLARERAGYGKGRKN